MQEAKEIHQEFWSNTNGMGYIYSLDITLIISLK